MERNEDLKGVAKIWRESFAFLPGILEALDRSFLSKKSLSRCLQLNSADSLHQQKLALSTATLRINYCRSLSCTTSLSISHEALLRALT